MSDFLPSAPQERPAVDSLSFKEMPKALGRRDVRQNPGFVNKYLEKGIEHYQNLKVKEAPDPLSAEYAAGMQAKFEKAARGGPSEKRDFCDGMFYQTLAYRDRAMMEGTGVEKASLQAEALGWAELKAGYAIDAELGRLGANAETVDQLVNGEIQGRLGILMPIESPGNAEPETAIAFGLRSALSLAVKEAVVNNLGGQTDESDVRFGLVREALQDDGLIGDLQAGLDSESAKVFGFSAEDLARCEGQGEAVALSMMGSEKVSDVARMIAAFAAEKAKLIVDCGLAQTSPDQIMAKIDEKSDLISAENKKPTGTLVGFAEKWHAAKVPLQ